MGTIGWDDAGLTWAFPLCRALKLVIRLRACESAVLVFFASRPPAAAVTKALASF
jgi:hypothetical protein